MGKVITVSCPLCGHAAPAHRKLVWMERRTSEKAWILLQEMGGRGHIRTVARYGPLNVPESPSERAVFDRLLGHLTDLASLLTERGLIPERHRKEFEDVFGRAGDGSTRKLT